LYERETTNHNPISLQVVIALLVKLALLTIFTLLLTVVTTLRLDGELYPEAKSAHLPVGRTPKKGASGSILVTYVDTIVERAVLSDTNETRLVVGARHDGAQSVVSSRKARDVSGQLVILIKRRIETLEEHEDSWVLRGGRSRRRNTLHDHVAVADDDSLVINGLQGVPQVTVSESCTRKHERIAYLRRRIVLGVGIGEEPSMEVVDRQPQRERLTVRQARVLIWREDKLARGLFVLGTETAHLLHASVKMKATRTTNVYLPG
jgi:hypothetical protein